MDQFREKPGSEASRGGSVKRGDEVKKHKLNPIPGISENRNHQSIHYPNEKRVTSNEKQKNQAKGFQIVHTSLEVRPATSRHNKSFGLAFGRAGAIGGHFLVASLLENTL